MVKYVPEASIEVFHLPDWKVIHESLEEGFNEIFPDIGDELSTVDRYWHEQSILWKKLRSVDCVFREHICRWFLYFLEPILFDLYHNGTTESKKIYPMEGDLAKIALYMVSGVRNGAPRWIRKRAEVSPLYALWVDYVPEKQRNRFSKNMYMEIVESGAAAWRGNFYLEIGFREKSAEIKEKTMSSVDFLLQHPADKFDECIRSLMIPGETKDVINEVYTANYLQHIRTVMINRIWQDIYRAMKEPNKDWHFEYRESDLAMILWHKKDQELNKIFQKVFPSFNIILRIDPPHGWHGGEYQPAIIIDVRSRERRELAPDEKISDSNTEFILHGGHKAYNQGVAVGGYVKEREDFLEILSYPLGCKRVKSNNTETT